MDATAPRESILARTARGAGWVIGWRMANRLVGLVNTLVLARLLVPADFGLVALATTFSAAIDTLSNVGVEGALIRAPRPSRQLFDTGFTLNLLRAAVTALIIAASALPITRFYGDPRLAPLLFLLAAGAFVDGFENVGIIAFRRDLTFHKEFQLRVAPRLLGVAVTITAALIWRSYWALMAGIMVGRVALLVQGYVMHPFRPRLGLGAWREIAGYSFWTWLIGLVGTVHDRGVNLAIGRVLGAAGVGIFMIGGEMASLPTSEMVLPLARACFPGFAAVREEGGSAGVAFLRIVSVMILLSLPAGVGLALVAAPVIRIAFGAQWMAAVPVMRVLALIGALSVFSVIGSTLLSAHGVLRPLFWLSLGGAAMKLPLLVVLGMRYGLFGAAVAIAVTAVIEQAINLVVVLRHIEVRFGQLAAAIWRPVVATATMAAVLGLSGLGWSAPAEGAGRLGLTLLAAVAAGVAAYGAALMAAWAACGRPAGAEADVLALIRQALARAARLAHLVSGR